MNRPPYVWEVSYLTPCFLALQHADCRDIDGDGRLDYCVVNNAGDITCWRSGGIEKDTSDWQELGVIWKMSDSGISNPGNEQLRLGKW